MNAPAKIKIFLVDDDPMFIEVLRHTLDDGKTDIKSFSCGEECLKSMKEEPKIIVLDYALNSSLNGVQVLNKIRHINPDAKVIVISGFGKSGVPEDTLKYGAYSYITKDEDALTLVKYDVERICEDLEKEEEVNKERKQIWWINAGVILMVLLMYIISRLH